MAETQVTYSQQFELPQLAREQTVHCTQKQWRRYVDRIKGCSDAEIDWHQAIGWVCVGFAGSAFLSAATLPASVSFTLPGALPGSTVPNMAAIITEVTCIALTLASAAVAFNSLWYSKKAAEAAAKVLTIIAEDMEAIGLVNIHDDSSAEQVKDASRAA